MPSDGDFDVPSSLPWEMPWKLSPMSFHAFFLVWATLANCCKQISMLTSSSTTNCHLQFAFGWENGKILETLLPREKRRLPSWIYWGLPGRDTLKGCGSRVCNVLGVYIVLQACELFCLYHEIRAVEFKVLNFERFVQLVTCFIRQEQPLPTTHKKWRRRKRYFCLLNT